MRCPRCGKQIPEGSRFCMHCDPVKSRINDYYWCKAV
ncbi:MAG: zinc-ribbon domain-containing protein [Candidatus Syntropharchaeia archaeon]